MATPTPLVPHRILTSVVSNPTNLSLSDAMFIEISQTQIADISFYVYAINNENHEGYS